MTTADIVLMAAATLLFKHLVADFLLQTSYQAANKGLYGHPGGLAHALTHAAFTPLVFIVLPAAPKLALAILASEYVWHYHQDWLKEQIVNRLKLEPSRHGFWWALGVDQFVHALTYLVMVYVLIHQRPSA